MNNQTFYNEIRTQINQFIHAFDDTIISRFEKDGTISKKIAVGYVYSPKSITLHHIVNKNDHIKFPLVAIWLTGISRDSNRVFNKHEGHFYNSLIDPSKSRHILQPVPVDIGLSMSIMTKYGKDMDQILSNFIPYNDPYIILSWQREELEGQEIRIPVVWNGNVQLSYPTEPSLKDAFRFEASTGFTLKGWIFKKDAADVGKIYKIHSEFSTHKEILTFDEMEREKDEADLYDIEKYDTFDQSAVPAIAHIAPKKLAISTFNRPLFSKKVRIFGSGFTGIDGVFLSGSSYTLSSYDFYSDYSSLSSENPPFDGYELSSWNVISDSMMDIYIEEPISDGYVDIILKNEAGYGTLIGNYQLSSMDGIDYYTEIGIDERLVDVDTPQMYVEVPDYFLSGFELF